MDLDPDPAIFVIDLQDANKNYLSFSANNFLKAFHHFSKIKSQKYVGHKAVGIKVFLTIFAW